MPDFRPTLHVCVTCRAGTDEEPGQRLHDALAARATHAIIRPVTCLASCDHGCAATISQPGKWTYLLGRLTPDLVDDLDAYAGVYAQTRTGAVLPSRRPASLNRVVLGRVPSMETAE